MRGSGTETTVGAATPEIFVSEVIMAESFIALHGTYMHGIIESVDSICRDSTDTQYMLIQTNFSKSL